MEELPFCDRFPSLSAPVNACKAQPAACATTIVVGTILVCVAPEVTPLLVIP